MNQTVTQGWNDVVFDVSGADAFCELEQGPVASGLTLKGGQGNDLC